MTNSRKAKIVNVKSENSKSYYWRNPNCRERYIPTPARQKLSYMATRAAQHHGKCGSAEMRGSHMKYDEKCWMSEIGNAAAWCRFVEKGVEDPLGVWRAWTSLYLSKFAPLPSNLRGGTWVAVLYIYCNDSWYTFGDVEKMSQKIALRQQRKERDKFIFFE
jgi:hypothetical protein